MGGGGNTTLTGLTSARTTVVRGRLVPVDWAADGAWVAAVLADTQADRYEAQARGARAYSAHAAWLRGDRPPDVEGMVRNLCQINHDAP